MGVDAGFMMDTRDRTPLKAKPLVPVENNTLVGSILSTVFWTLLIVYTFVFLFGDFFLPQDKMEWCQAAKLGYPAVKSYPNPDANNNPCYYERTWYLLGLTHFEVTFSRRMIVSVLLGAAIGFERKATDRPAGVRTMSLVSLGACFFTMCGMHAFRSSPQEFDAARVSAAIPSGVGFLGSALIWKRSSVLAGTANEVHGLTTAASVWLSASVGIGAGGGLFILSSYCVVLVVVVLRIGPRMFFQDDASSISDTESWGDSQHGAAELDELDKSTPEEQRPMEKSVRASLRNIHQSGLSGSIRQGSRRSLSQPTFGS